MVEVAICLAIIGFALVAIIGVLPSGMRVQKDNREETIINQDATYWLEAIRSGALGSDMLTNHVDYIVVHSQALNSRLVPSGTVQTAAFVSSRPNTSILAPTPVPGPAQALLGGAHIVGLLSTPRYEPLQGGGYRSNYVIAYVRAISGPAVEKGANTTSREFSFHYRLVPEIIPAGWTALQNFDWRQTNQMTTNQIQQVVSQWNMLRTTAANLHEVRLLFRWPVLSGRDPDSPTEPRIGNGRQLFRTMAGGTLDLRIMAQPQQRLITNYFFQPTQFQVVNRP